MERLADFRNVFAQVVVARGGCSQNRSLLQAFATVPRHVFLGAGPWAVREDGTQTVSDDPASVYQDIGVGLARGIPTGLPSLHAALLDAADLRPGHRVMHVGAGTGYYTAILAELVGPSGQVTAFEIDEELAARARGHLAAWPWVTVEAVSGVRAPGQPMDLVYVNAGVQQLPRAWLEALAVGGQLVFPLVSGHEHGGVFAVRREQAAYSARFLCRARFVPCIGAQDDASRAALDAAFRGPACEAVRSLRTAPELPDGTAWFAGDGWWLSLEPVAPA